MEINRINRINRMFSAICDAVKTQHRFLYNQDVERIKDDTREVRRMERAERGMTWKEIAGELTEEFMEWGCRYTRKQLPEIAMGYECTPLFFWNWMDDPEVHRSEKGFLRVLGYAWRKHLQAEADTAPQAVNAAGTVRAEAETVGKAAA